MIARTTLSFDYHVNCVRTSEGLGSAAFANERAHDGSSIANVNFDGCHAAVVPGLKKMRKLDALGPSALTLAQNLMLVCHESASHPGVKMFLFAK